MPRSWRDSSLPTRLLLQHWSQQMLLSRSQPPTFPIYVAFHYLLSTEYAHSHDKEYKFFNRLFVILTINFETRKLNLQWINKVTSKSSFKKRFIYLVNYCNYGYEYIVSVIYIIIRYKCRPILNPVSWRAFEKKDSKNQFV